MTYLIISLTVLDTILIYLMIGFVVWVDIIYKHEFKISSLMIIPSWPAYVIVGVKEI